MTLAAAIVLTSTAHAEEAPNTAMFGRMAGLVGDWEGTFEWSGARKASGSLKATFYLTGNGSALVENLINEGIPSMTSVYHLDGSDLRMTHYCAARNQPRLRASKIDVAAGSVEFEFVDVTNLTPSSPGHVKAFDLRLLDADRIHLRFVFGGGAADAIEDISLQRVKAAKS